jgi:glutamate synthase domain-containing protein 3
VTVKGSTGYYCGGMNKQATIRVAGSVGPGVAENMMSGTVIVEGDASQYAGATGHGGLLVIKGNASSRCGISMKGIDIVVHGNIGHMSAFMAQAGNLVVCGDAGEALGDSLYEARLFVRGKVKASAPIAWKRRCGPSIWSFWPTCWSAPALRRQSRRSSAATARPASSTISTSTTPIEY